MTSSEKTRLAEIDAPYGRRVRLDEIAYPSGMNLLRVTIQEGARYTILELDAATATRWADEMGRWARTQPTETG
jgi:hypothetical protein